jgi:cytochrome oxidase Cu insertion factor (SCO1/SenC/PrrC family)
VRYALTLTGIGLLFGGFAGGLLWLGTREPEGAFRLGGRVALVCAAAGVAAALARLICGGESDRLLTVHFVKGEIAGVLGFIVALGLVGFFAEPPTPPAARAAAGEPVSFAGPTLDGGRLSLADRRGEVVLVYFWASWNRACAADLPQLKMLRDRYGADKLRLVGVSMDSKREALEQYLKAHPLSWPQIFFDEPGKQGTANPVAAQFKVKVPRYMVVVDRAGKVAYRGAPGPGVEQTLGRLLGPAAQPPAVSPLQWWFAGVIRAPWWLLLGMCVGAAVAFAFVEAGLRRLLRRPAPAGGAADVSPAGPPTPAH